MICDIHILAAPGRETWRAEAISSLSGQPCSLEVITGPVDGTPIGTYRSSAFRLGSSPYVGYVDDDDIVSTGAVERLIVALENDPAAVGAYTDEVLVDEHNKVIRNGASTGKAWSPRRQLGNIAFVHHLWIGRRAVLEPLLEETEHLSSCWHWGMTCLMAAHGHWIHVPYDGYRWRQHPGSLRLKEKSASHSETTRLIAKRWVQAGVMTKSEVPTELLPHV